MSQLTTTLTALCTFVVIGILVVILSYITMRGVGALNLRFLVDAPRPVGDNARRQFARNELKFTV